MADCKASIKVPSAEELGFDPDKLRKKYRQERDKRVRPDGNEQYVTIAGDFSNYVDDPWADPEFAREPLHDKVDVLVIGGGFGGLAAGVELRKAGVENIRFVEKGGDFGGTWYWNRYPGAQCDIESYIYLPFLEETGYIPKEKYSYAPEIREQALRVARQFDLYRDTCFQTEVTGLEWQDDESRWLVSTDWDDQFLARFVITCSGPLNRPKLPAIPGIDRFKGHSFHTSRWDFDYTGGDTNGGLERLADKKVGIIGTGCTAIQCTPFVAEFAKELYVFQRTPSSVSPRGNKPTDEAWAQSRKPGWQKERRDNFNTLTMGRYAEEDLVHDGWTDLFRNIANIIPKENFDTEQTEEIEAITELEDFKKMNEIRAHIEETVNSPETAEALKPWYRMFCKRPTFNDDYLPTFNRPNVKLIDTSETHGVEGFSERGALVKGEEIDLDCVIFATGFEVGKGYTRRVGFEIIGRDGLTLTDHWADGMRTFHGYASHGFPNLFHMGMLQVGASVNFMSMLEPQAHHIGYIVKEVMARKSERFEVSSEAEAGWVDEINENALDNFAFWEACTPGYYNNEGRPAKPGTGGRGWTDPFYGLGPLAFDNLLAAWREAGGLDGLDLS